MKILLKIFCEWKSIISQGSWKGRMILHSDGFLEGVIKEKGSYKDILVCGAFANNNYIKLFKIVSDYADPPFSFNFFLNDKKPIEPFLVASCMVDYAIGEAIMKIEKEEEKFIDFKNAMKRIKTTKEQMDETMKMAHSFIIANRADIIREMKEGYLII